MKLGIYFGQNAVNQDSYDGWAGLLSGCCSDARDLAVAFAHLGYTTECRFSGWNVAGKQMPWVMSSQCTLEAWRILHEKLQRDAQAGDTIVIGNSGHGGQYDTPTEFNGGETLCFWNGQLRDDELHDMMCGWKAGVNVAYLLDSCHSGGMQARELLPHAIRSAPGWVGKMGGTIIPRAMKGSDISANVLQLCACQKSEVAADGQYNGAFTACFANVWAKAAMLGKNMTWQQWFDDTSALMATNFPNQHPALNVLGGGGDLLTQVV